MFISVRPLSVKILYLFSIFKVSIEIQIVDDPKIFTASLINFYYRIAPVFIETLSAPLIKVSFISLYFLFLHQQ